MSNIFDSRDEIYKKPFGAVCNGDTVSFKVIWEERNAVTLTICHEASNTFFNVPMYNIKGNEWYIEFQFPEVGLYFYRFESGDEYIGKLSDDSNGVVISDFDDNWFLQVVYSNNYLPASDFYGKVIYQIFPDRFYRSFVIPTEFSERIIHSNLNAVPSYRPIEEHMDCIDFFGGNLKGIEEKLPYLKELGVGIVYLNPIFLSHSNHRYDTADYMVIDPLLGTNEDFERLCSSAKDYGISIILDGVFSHTGADSIYFDRFGRYGHTGAYMNESSRYRDWYFFDNSKIGYRCWWGFYTLPEINEDNESFREFICGLDGVINYWMSLGAAGFRLDVADELPDSFIVEVRKAIKRHGDDKLLIGEVWENAATKVAYKKRRKYLLGDELDSVMNYPFREAILSFIRFGDAEKFMNCIMEIVEAYPKPMMDSMMNLLSTHDTERLINALVAPALNKDRHWQANHHINHDEYLRGVEMAKLSFAILFTLPGIPSIYYGDEVGMTGYKDPFNRGYFSWDKIDNNLRDYICNLSKIRSKYSAFCDGLLIPLVNENNVIAFLRQNEKQTVIVIVNRSDSIFRYTLKGRTFTVEPWKVTIELLENLYGE